MILLRKVLKKATAEPVSSTLRKQLILTALPWHLVEVPTPARISGFVSINLIGFACLECEQFWAGPLHGCMSSLRWAPQLSASHVISHSSNNSPAPAAWDTRSSFVSCSDTDVSLFPPQRRDCMFVATELQYNY